MELIFYLFNLTLKNYIEENSINPIYEAIFINFISSNISIIHSNESISNFINFFHLEMDNLYYRYPKSDIKFAVKKILNSSPSFNPKLTQNIKGLARNIYEKYLFLNKH